MSFIVRKYGSYKGVDNYTVNIQFVRVLALSLRLDSENFKAKSKSYFLQYKYHLYAHYRTHRIYVKCSVSGKVNVVQHLSGGQFGSLPKF